MNDIPVPPPDPQGQQPQAPYDPAAPVWQDQAPPAPQQPGYYYPFPQQQPAPPLSTGLIAGMVILSLLIPILGPLIALIVGVTNGRRQGALSIWIPALILLILGVPVLGIIASISIPVMLSARQGAIRETARNSLRTVVSAEAAYYAANGEYADLATLGDPSADTNPPGQTAYIDAQLASGVLDNGITIRIDEYSATSFHASAITESETVPDYEADEVGLVTEMDSQ
jgi:type II secretory pathway pseudopilin PulG